MSISFEVYGFMDGKHQLIDTVHVTNEVSEDQAERTAHFIAGYFCDEKFPGDYRFTSGQFQLIKGFLPGNLVPAYVCRVDSEQVRLKAEREAAKQARARKPSAIRFQHELSVQVTKGDLTHCGDLLIAADGGDVAIATCVNTGGMWFGGLDAAIQRTAGNHYHRQAMEHLTTGDWHDGEAILADGVYAQHSGAFNHVIFVADDLTLPVERLVKAALDMAKEYDVPVVGMPLFRTGVMLGAYEPDADSTIAGILDGLKACEHLPIKVIIVVYGDEALYQQVKELVR